MNVKVMHTDVVRLEREHQAAVEGLRAVRDNSISWDDARAIAEEALLHCGVVPQPKFEEQIADFLAKHEASLGLGLQRLAAGDEAVTREFLAEHRCASCESNGANADGPAGLCDGCLDALGDQAA